VRYATAFPRAWPALVAIACALLCAGGAAAAESGSTPPAGASEDGLEHLVPELAENPYRLEPGTRPYLHRLSFSPGYGRLGSETLFTFRLAYNPSSWLGYEGAIGHNPGQAVHAVLHSVNAIVRHPLPGRFQPYLSGGYGMVMVSPGESINASPVTKNAMTVGGGLELYVRSDLAIRAEMLYATVFGKQKDREGVVTYDYLQQSIGLSFYRSIRP
jgi:opacity protein-like surface antigen